MLKSSLCTLATAALLATGSAQAATVLIDFAADNVAASPDTNGNYWNSIGTGSGSAAADTTAENLLLSDGSGNSTWDIFVDHYGGTSGNRSGYGGTGIDGPVGSAAPFDVTGSNRPTIDGIFAGPDQVFITFSDLTAETDYVIELIGGRVSNTSDGLITLTVGTAVSGLDGSDQGVIEDTGAILSFKVKATAGGLITFAYEVPSATGTEGRNTLNAASISEVPEPGSLALLGLGGLCMLKRRRRNV